jgi:xylulokinase
VTFGLKYAVGALERSGVRPTRLTLVGGGAASSAWAQLCADAFETPVERPVQTEAAALGGARQARWAADGQPVQPGGAVDRRFQPEPSAALRDAARRADKLREIAVSNSL